MTYSQITMPTSEEIARIERRARAMRAEATSNGLKAIGAWVSRRFRGGGLGNGAAARA